jgi:hypothetical protein
MSDSNDTPPDPTGPAASPPLTRTPLFRAISASRYQRQDLIREIQGDTKSKLLCYVAGTGAPIDDDDVPCFFDLLRNVSMGMDVDLLLRTGGGDIDVAEKVMNMVRNKVGTARLRVIVPDYARNAGTLMALGANVIVMSETSELGSINPQVVRSDRSGNHAWQSVKNYLDAYDKHLADLRSEPNDIGAALMFEQFDPATVQQFRAMLRRVQTCAERQLTQGMMSLNGNWSLTASRLIEWETTSNGQPISWEDAADPRLGLTVEHLDPEDPLWLKFWELYCLQILSVPDRQKLFESEIVSLCIDSRAG